MVEYDLRRVTMYNVKEEYKVNKEFRDYVGRCCKNKNVMPEELLKVAVIQEVGKYYYEKRKEGVEE